MKKLALIVVTLISIHGGFSLASPQAPGGPLTPRVVWFDLMVNDLPAAQAFYGKLFDWKVKPYAANYHMIESGGTEVGGMYLSPGKATEGRLAVYFEVEEVKGKLELATSLGATVIVEPRNLPQGEGSFALFRDLEGNAIGLLSKNSI